MPISREQFDKGMEDENYKIISFLKAHSKEAFEIGEMMDEVYGKGTPSKTTAEASARSKKLEFPLAELVKQGVVEKKTIGDKDYYAIRLD